MNLLLTGCFSYSELQIQKLKDLGYSICFMQHEAEGVPLSVSEIDAIVCNVFFFVS